MSFQAFGMVNKKLVAFASIVFAVGLLLGTVVLRPDFSSNQYKTYPVQAEIMHAYFKTYNTSADSGLSNTMMVSYVFVLNVTNLSDTKLSISQVLLDCANLFHYTLNYRQGSNDYWFYPHTSRLIAVSQTSGLNSFGLEILNSGGGPVFIFAVGLTPSEGRGGGSSASEPQLHLHKVSADEYVYGSTFKDGSYFSFDNWALDIGVHSGRIV